MENLDLVYTTVFVPNIKMGQLLIKTVFCHKMNHILLNYAFMLFLSIFREIHCKLLVLVIKKVTISERSTEKHRKFVFLKKFE